MFIPHLFRNKSFAIDLGNNNTLLADQENILLSEPSYVVFDSLTGKVNAVGDKAYDIFEKNHQDLMPVKPLKWGVIADYDSTLAMLRSMIAKTSAQKTLLSGYDQIISGVPFATTEVERRALHDTLDQFNPRSRYLLVEPLAAALGMGLNIREPDGKMLIDIGGGITEIVVISLSGIAVFQSIKTAGDSFTDDIRDYLRKEYNLLIGWKTAEQIKMRVGAVLEKIPNPPDSIIIKGKDVVEGLPVSKLIGHTDVHRMLDRSMRNIEDHIIQALEICPPELAADIYQNGIHVTGGGALLRGMKERLERTTQLSVHLDPEPLLSVSRGISTTLRDTKKYRTILLN